MSPTNFPNSKGYMNITPSTITKSSDKPPSAPSMSMVSKTAQASAAKNNVKRVDFAAECSSSSDTEVTTAEESPTGYVCMTAGRKTPTAVKKLHDLLLKHGLSPDDDELIGVIAKLMLKMENDKDGANERSMRLDDDGYLLLDPIDDTASTSSEEHVVGHYENIPPAERVYVTPPRKSTNPDVFVPERIVRIQCKNTNDAKQTAAASHYENDVQAMLTPLRRPLAPVRQYSDPRMRPPTIDAPSAAIQTGTSGCRAAARTAIATKTDGQPAVTASRCYRRSTMPSSAAGTWTYKPTLLPSEADAAEKSAGEQSVTYRDAKFEVSQQVLPLREANGIHMTDCLVIKLNNDKTVVAATQRPSQGGAGPSTASSNNASSAEPPREQMCYCCIM